MRALMGLLVGLVVWQPQASGQNNPNLIDTAFYWNVNLVIGAIQYVSYSTCRYVIDADTSINAITYKKVLACFDDSTYCPGNWQYAGAIRSDTVKSVYLVEPGKSTEGLLYDFGLTVGDTVKVGFSDPVTLVVDSVDSLTLSNNEKRKLLRLNVEPQYSTLSPDYWVEGVGSLNGLLESGRPPIPDHETRLLCFGSDDTLLYTDSIYWDYWGCFWSNVGITEPIQNNGLNIFPNPFTNSTIIKSSSPISSYRLYSLSGQLVQEEHNLTGNIVTIDRGNLPNGMYFVEISTVKHLNRQKVIIQ